MRPDSKQADARQPLLKGYQNSEYTIGVSQFQPITSPSATPSVASTRAASPISPSAFPRPNRSLSGVNSRISGRASPPSEMSMAMKQYTWDYVMVFVVGDADKKVTVRDKERRKTETTQKEYFSAQAAKVIEALRGAGLFLDLYYSLQKDELYCRIAADEQRLMEEAARIEYNLQLDALRCHEYASSIGLRLAQVTNQQGSGVTMESWDHLYARYDRLDPKQPEQSYKQELYRRYNTQDKGHPRHNSPFSSVDRLRLTYNIIEAEKDLGGAGLAISQLMQNEDHPLKAVFPLHERNTREKLKTKWSTWLSAIDWKPLDGVRSYFGESVAMYFGFLTFYTTALIPICVLGVAMFIWQMVEDRIDVEGLPAFALLISLWATLLLELWKRKESVLRMRWGMSEYLQKEQPRPEFKGDWKSSPIDGKLVEMFPWHQKLVRLLFSNTVIASLIGVVIASVISIFFFRQAVRNYTWGVTVTGIVNAVQIQILNFIYSKVAFKLNSYENHRTDTEYENALISKTFLFKFVNSYNSFFYIAFIKKYDGGCLYDDCLKELQQQLITVFISSIVISNAVEIVLPWVMNKVAERQNAVNDSRFAKSPAEEEFELEQYEGTFSDFDEIVVQFGYVTLFVVAFPLAPLLAFANNLLEARVDSTKLLMLTRRPEPKGAYDIGTWYDIISIVSYIAVITNTAMVVNTNLMVGWTGGDIFAQCIVFIATEHAILLLKFAISYFVPDDPSEVVMHLARNEYVENVLINQMEDEEFDLGPARSRAASFDSNNKFDWGVVLDHYEADEGHEWLAVPAALSPRTKMFM